MSRPTAPYQLSLPELSLASGWCQRWTASRTHSWGRRGQGGFDPDRYQVGPVDDATAKAYVCARHYSGSYPAAMRRYGLYHRDRLAGVAVFSCPVQLASLTGLFPDLEPLAETLDLGRFVLDDGVPANGESWFLARCFAELAALGIQGVSSYADPVPRHTAGRLITPGHVGIIYQAANAVYTGRSAARTITALADGTVLNDRTAAKVRGQQRGHRAAEARLIALGAPVPRAGQPARTWLADALDTIGARRYRHRGCHRYAFTIGARRHHIRVGPLARPYPKHLDPPAA